MKNKLLLTFSTLLLLIGGKNIKAQVSFAPAVNYIVGFGSSLYSVFSADFNGDGKMDLVTANAAGNNVSILLGSGTGTFAAAVNYAVGSGPQAVLSADFNGDGKMDLASVNSADNTVSILLGSGTGTFAAAVNYAAGSNSNAIFSADFNGDGKMDLVTANYSSNNISVLLGSGTGTFSAPVNYSVGSGPQGVFSADFNGDGKMDLATANFDSNNISILLGSGTGTFAAAVNYAVLANPQAVFSADFNGDGKMDLAVANLGINKVSVLLGSGTGTFAAAVNYNVGSGPISVFSADFNGDGKLDLATANQSGSNVSILLGNGSGTFGTAINFAGPSTPMCVFSADFNGDGRADLATANQSTTISILLNTSTFPTGASLNFDGTNDFVNITNNSSFNFGTNDFTIETYAKTSSVSGNRVMIGKINGGNNFWFGVSNGKANFSLIGGPDALGTSTIGDGNWHHLAAVRQNGVVSLYVDGVLEASQNNTGTATINGNLTFGNFNGGFNFPGSLDEVRLWNRALCKGEILNNKNAELPSLQTGLVAYYNFNQGLSATNNSTVTILNDLSGNANHGTLNNFALSGTTSNWVAPGAVTSGSTAPTYTPVSTSVSSLANVLCNGGNTGSATVTTTGGTSPYTYLASTGATVSTLSNLTAGAYTYTVTDANTCKAIQTLTITQPSALVTNTVITNVACNGGSTGAINLSVSGGASGYTFMWNDGITTEDRIGLVAGVKTVTVTDANSCTKIQSATITEPTAISTSTSITNVLCNGGSTGTINLSVSGGASGYTFMWNDGITTEDRTGLVAGVKTVTVTDANGCTKIQSATITEPTAINLTTSASNSTICSGSSSTITANATGGTGTITYSWVAGPNANVSVVSPTSTTVYTVNVTDANSCVQTATVSVVANVCTPAEALNFDGVNDYISLPTNPVSGDFTIEYWVKTTQIGGGPQWYGGIGIVDAEYPGVTNDFGTALVGNKFAFGIGNPDATIVSTTNINDGSWHHVAGTWVMSTGAMSLYVDGVLESTGIGSTNPRNVPTRITIGCMQTLFTYFNGEIDEVRIWNNARTQCEINTYKNCEIPTTATGLLANYHFNQGIDAGANTSVTTLTDASASTLNGTLTNMTLTGTTSNWVYPGGVTSGSVTPANVTFTVGSTVSNSVICSGNSTTLNGTGADTYIWTGTILDGVSFTPTTTATYTVTGTNTLTGCTNTALASVTVNPLPSITANSGNVTTCGDVSADFGIVASGNNNTYEWHYDAVGGSDHGVIDGTYTEINFNTDTMTVQQVLTGNYNNYYVYCYVTNEFGCVARSANDTIVANPTPTISVNSGSICSGQSFTMTPSGASTYTYSGGSDVVMPTADATYTVTGTDANGCENTAVSTVTVNALPNVSVNSGAICTGQSFTMTPSGATTYTYSNGNSVVTPTANATYSVSGTDANGCVSATDAVSTVTVNALPVLTAVTNNTLLCVGQTATLSVSGATTYTWSTTENTSSVAVSPTVQTTYTVNGADANGCENTTTVTQDVSACTGIATLINDASINVYPNPNKGMFVVELTSVSKVTVMNALGQVVITETFEAGKHTVNINNESTGVYFVKVMTNNKQQIIKVIKE